MLEKIEIKAQEVASQLGLEIVSVRMKNDGTDKILEIIADKPGESVDVDDLSVLNKAISDYCDSIGLTDLDYVEVSSRGIGDELLTDEERVHAVGCDVDISLTHKLKGLTVLDFHGILESYSATNINIKAQIKGATRHISLLPADIKMMREHIDIDDENINIEEQ